MISAWRAWLRDAPRTARGRIAMACGAALQATTRGFNDRKASLHAPHPRLDRACAPSRKWYRSPSTTDPRERPIRCGCEGSTRPHETTRRSRIIRHLAHVVVRAALRAASPSFVRRASASRADRPPPRLIARFAADTSKQPRTARTKASARRLRAIAVCLPTSNRRPPSDSYWRRQRRPRPSGSRSTLRLPPPRRCAHRARAATRSASLCAHTAASAATTAPVSARSLLPRAC